ncbi:MAG: hypothetical protein A2341_05595 [Deltaproteobacteria bacterium RIFOXYB12_FULL_58_9]|nr:MAG: hypothetical protein A2341_05595 [Deltaproteobacteria bacterium RIFOXYB12_FULL_58_9]
MTCLANFLFELSTWRRSDVARHKVDLILTAAKARPTYFSGASKISAPSRDTIHRPWLVNCLNSSHKPGK